SSIISFYSNFFKFCFLFTFCHKNKQERLAMSDAAEILQSVQIGLNVVIFLLKTDRGPQATELCNECAILLQNLDCGRHLDISVVISNEYYTISGNTNVERYAKTLLYTLHHAGRLTIKLGDKYEAQRRFVEAKQLYNSAVIIMQTIGHKREEAMAHEGLGTRAKEYNEKALAIAIEIGDRKGEGTSNGNLGNVFHSLCQYQKAKEYYEKALAIDIEIGNRPGEGPIHGNLGKVFHSQGEYQKAKEYYERALAISIEIGDRHGKGRLNGNLGNVFHSLGEYQKAKEYYEKALAIAIEFGDRKGEGTINGNLGTVFHSLCQYQKAKEYYEKGLAIAIEIGDRQGEGTINGNFGNVFYSLGEYQKAKEYYEKALAIAIEIGGRRGEGRFNGNLGNVFYSLGEYQKAKEYYEKALAIAIEIGGRQQEGIVSGNLGNVFHSLGEYQKAKEYYEKALDIGIEIGNRQGEGTSNGNLGHVFHSLGEYQKAQEYYEKALAIGIETGDRQGEGTSNGNLGNVFHSLGEYQKAQEYYEKALAIAIEIGDRQGEGTINGNIGNVFHFLCEYQKAKESYEKALAIAIEIGDRQGEGRTKECLGSVFHSLGKYQQAKEYYEEALANGIEIGDRQGERTINRRLGRMFDSLGEHHKAKKHYEKALAIITEIGGRKGEEYLNLGNVYFHLRKNRQAKKYLDKAFGISIASGDRILEAKATASLAAVFASVNDNQKAKEHCVKALTINRECGNRSGEAQNYLSLGNLHQSLGECSKAEDCLKKAYSMSSQIGDKMLKFKSLLSITLVKITQSEVLEAKEYLLRCIAKYEQIRTFLKGNSEFKMSLLEKHGTFPYRLLTDLLCDIAKFEDALYVEELARARVLAELMADKYSVESHISADPQSWFGIKNIVRRESNCVFLYISHRERQVFLWVLKANGGTCFRKTDKVEVDTLIDERVCDVEGIFKKSAAGFGVLPTANCEDRSLDDNVTTSLHKESRANLRGEQTKDTERIHRLCYKWIVAPVEDLLTEPEIIIVPDRFSYRVPFAALRDKSAGRYLSEKYRIRIVPSLTTLRIIQECPADYHSLTNALVVGDPTPLLGSRATKQAVLQAIPSVSLIHLAAHGNAERGEIALSPQHTTDDTPQEEDYLLTMSEIQGVQVRAKLVVLSCCHSGRGLVKKEGVLGIARAFLASGARSVLVASWAIEDEATEQLMNHFYEHLVRGESASESLHQAVQWLRSNGFPKPSQWAPFVLMGDNVTFDFTGKSDCNEQFSIITD
ncbi:unnamed protein product, partial [Pocillopora meandrina]